MKEELIKGLFIPFQFLIGSLVTVFRKFDVRFTTIMFQFLIGSLVTLLQGVGPSKLSLFQFLIGSLVTKKAYALLTILELCFNSL